MEVCGSSSSTSPRLHLQGLPRRKHWDLSPPAAQVLRPPRVTDDFLPRERWRRPDM